MLKLVSRRICSLLLQERAIIVHKYGTKMYKNSLASPSHILCSHASTAQHMDRDSIGQDMSNMRGLFVYHLQTLLGCNAAEAQKIFDSRILNKHSVRSLTQCTTMLIDRHIRPETLVEYPSALGYKPERLKIRLIMLESMEPRDINDFVPLLQMPLQTTNKLLQRFNMEKNFVPGKHRIYYFSDRMDLEPILVANYFSTHPFMFEIAWDNLVENLNVFLSYKVEPLNILKDLWAFRYLPSSIIARLERAKQARKDKIMPWMVRCPEAVLKKTLQLTEDNYKLLAANETVVDYLSERLGYHKDIMHHIVLKHPAVLRCRVTKIKDILDFLLNEAGFETHHIAQVPRILCHSLETTKVRLEELHTLFGYRPTTLVTLCKSRREYQKLLHDLAESAERRKRFQTTKQS